MEKYQISQEKRENESFSLEFPNRYNLPSPWDAAWGLPWLWVKCGCVYSCLCAVPLPSKLRTICHLKSWEHIKVLIYIVLIISDIKHLLYMAYWPLYFVFCDLPFPISFLTSFVYEIFSSLIYRIPVSLINLLHVKYLANIFLQAHIYTLYVLWLYKGFYLSYSKIRQLFSFLVSRFGPFLESASPFQDLKPFP